MAQKKYEFLPVEEITFRGYKMKAQRIRALIDIPMHNVTAGDLGGYIDCHRDKKNRRVLDHSGDCWVGENAIVMGNIFITNNALVSGNAIVKSYWEKLWEGEKPAKKDLYDSKRHTSFIQGNSTIRDDSIISMTLGSLIAGEVIIENKANVAMWRDCVITDMVKVNGNASVVLNDRSSIRGSTILKDDCSATLVRRSKLKGNSRVENNAVINLKGDSIIESSIFSDNAKYSTLKGWRSYTQCIDTSFIDNANVTVDASKDELGTIILEGCSFSGDANLTTKETIRSITMAKGVYKNFHQQQYSINLLHEMITSGGIEREDQTNREVPVPSLSPETLMYKKRLAAVEAKFNAYQYDIVQLIKYPVMADLSNINILNLVHCLDVANTLFENNLYEDIPEAVKDAERYFLLAESKARIAVDTNIDEKGQSVLRRAKSLLAIAHNESSSENEKKISCERVLKELKGILPLEDKLIDNLRISVGLKELEA